MTGVIVAVAVPPSRYAKYMAIISSVFAISSILGPLLGGAINEHSTWRWVFLLKYAIVLAVLQTFINSNSPPAAAVATALIVFLMPSSFSKSDQTFVTRLRQRFTWSAFQRLDLLGASLMLVASILLIYCLEEAGTRYPWKSAAIISPLIISVVSWLSFVQYEVFLERKNKVQEPILPMRLMKDRILAGMLLYVHSPTVCK